MRKNHLSNFLFNIDKAMNNSNIEDKIAQHIADVMMQSGGGRDADFENWIGSNEFAPEILERLSNYETLAENNKTFSVDKQEKWRESQRLLKRIEKYNRRKLFVKISAIASAMIVFSFVIWYGNTSNKIIDTAKNIAITKETTIPMIITENGEEFHLKNQEKVVISNDSIIQQNGEININNSIKDSVSYSNLVVPKQSTYTIELSDGTVVRINANSKLRFPNKFVGETREVTMEGEAFFDVAKDSKKPFIVNYKNIKIEVFGTQFNIDTYSKDIVKTFLVKGSVGVRFNHKLTMMSPNQLSEINEITNSNTISNITNNDSENIVGWLDGFFIFNNVEVKEVIKILSTWYQVKLNIDVNLNDRITARYKRDTPLEEIVESLKIITNKKILPMN